jgi:acyl-CoA hydrolase
MMDKIPKSPATSKTILSQLMQPEHSNSRGNIHGGWVMKLVDEAGALACMRHAQNRVVTVAVDRMTFNHPIQIGDLVILEAVVSYVGRTSLEAEVQVFAENPVTGTRVLTNTAYLVYVSLDGGGNPVEVPDLLLETEKDRKRFEEGKRRQKARLAQL